jgi:hypothetical protein
MASSTIPATLDTRLTDNGQNKRRIGLGSLVRSPRKGSNNSLNEQVPPSLPPLHPRQPNTHIALHRSRSTSDYDNDSVSVISTGSSIAPFDAGQHGFITYNDDASSTGSLVYLAYEQGNVVPPVAHDLPPTIFNVYSPNNDDKLLGEGLVPNRNSFNSVSVKSPHSSETDGFHLLPYHVRTKLSSQNTATSDECDAIIGSDVNATKQQPSADYGSIETGQDPAAGYHDNMSGVHQQHLPFNPPVSAYENLYSSQPIYASFEEPCIEYKGGKKHVLDHPPEKSNFMVYVTMLIALVLFVAAVYALFSVMKMMH